ncbi:Acetolactate synthase isozyme 3 large subunit [Paraburkholderia sediminicola]|uniref:Acetolactate synthase isozyme 3 large subunit n=1 Tax=Paraburkholderia sediminicola TaxID=458836 RepID=A0A6J5CQN7_9BURK|nr:thiamine pyrophosphate-dependent enzyme [Paraburkholderia sediminicola]CAB3743766.1 Acetolactate synthase isozyme 3 large subunit [Paraburkholderia sediminicola]
MNSVTTNTSAHAMLSVFASNGIDRVFLVPGESYLGILDALNDFPQIDVVTCRHEGGAGFMACADGRLTRKPGVVMVSRGPGATNASIAVHTAQQDAVPLILVIGQIPKADLRKEAFQEIDYQKMFGSVAKWVCEVTEPSKLAECAYKAVRMACSGTPGPVVLVVPEDIQQQTVEMPEWTTPPQATAVASEDSVWAVLKMIKEAKRPLLVAGGALDTEDGRDALRALAEKFHIPVAVSFRQHDIFPNTHELFAGDLGLVNPSNQIAAFESSDLVIALGTRLGDITSQGYRFPQLPRPSQRFVHVYPDDHIVGLHFVPDVGLVCDAAGFARQLCAEAGHDIPAECREWAAQINSIHRKIAAWPSPDVADGVPFVKVVERLAKVAPRDLVVCLDAGTFAAPVYRHFSFVFPQRLMSPLSGAMGYGTPSAIASQLRMPTRPVVCLVGDGGFLMTGNEIIAAVERKLPILFVLSNNNCYGSIRVHQDKTYPGRHVGTSLSNPDFVALARAYGVISEQVTELDQVDAALNRGLESRQPYLIEVCSSLTAILPAKAGENGTRSGD